jgi:hypothetical protein
VPGVRRDDALVPSVEADAEDALSEADAERRREARRVSVARIEEGGGRQRDETVGLAERRNLEDGNQRDDYAVILRSEVTNRSRRIPCALATFASSRDPSSLRSSG